MTQIRTVFRLSDWRRKLKSFLGGNDSTLVHPIKVCFDGDKYWLFDGYHRMEAMKSLGLNQCDVVIFQGDRRDALRRYIKDKLKVKGGRTVSKVFRHCMDVLIKDKEWLGLETKQLANMFGRIRKFFENLMVFAEIRRRICAMPVDVMCGNSNDSNSSSV